MKIKIRVIIVTPCLSWVVYVIHAHFWCLFEHIRCWKSQNDLHMSPDLHSWPWRSRSNILLNDLYYLWLDTCYRLDFSIDLNIIKVEELKKSEINYVAMRSDFEMILPSKKNGFTLKIKTNHQGQVTDFGFSEILNIINVKIDTKIKFAACMQPELRKVIQWICVTLTSKVNR